MRELILILMVTIAQPVLAHPGEHHGNAYATLWHVLTGPDHLAFTVIMLIVGVSSVVLARRRALKAMRSKQHDSR
jgi:hydrogenase/urease accessory protein HupE